ncbi:MAG: hypothetical protein AB8I08_23815 [Sandaracinaceae bacterium]
MKQKRRAWVVCWLAVSLWGCAEADRLATPVLSTCPPHADGVDPFERTFARNELDRMRLGPCGELTWRDGDGSHYLGPDFASVRPLTEDARSLSVSEAGDQVLVERADGSVDWRSVHGEGPSVAFEAERYGFVRDEDTSVAWFCAQGSLGRVGPAGVEVLAEPGTCDVWSATAAPVLAYVDAEFTLAVLDLRDGGTTTLPDVPFVAVSNDEVRLSRDGRILFHQPRNTPVPRIGVFDVRRDEGRRLLGAPESRRGLGSLREAADAGHTVAFQGGEHAYVVTPNGYLNVYPDMTLLSLSPDGTEAVLVTNVVPPEVTSEVLVSDLDSARVSPLPSAAAFGAHAPPERVITSWDGNAVVAEGRDPSFTVEGHRMSFRWDTREFAQIGLVNRESQARWVSETAVVLSQEGSISAQLGRVGQAPLHRLTSYGVSVVNSPMPGRVILRVRTAEGAERVVLASTESGESLELGTYEGLWAVMVDHAGARLVTLSDEPDPAMPARVLSRVVAEPMPSLP